MQQTMHKILWTFRPWPNETQVIASRRKFSLAIGWPNETQVERKSFAKVAEFLFFFFLFPRLRLGRAATFTVAAAYTCTATGSPVMVFVFLMFFNSLSLFSFSSSGLKFSEFCSVTEAILSK